MNHPSVLLSYPPQSITHFVLPSVHTCTCVCARVHTYTSVYVCVHLPVKGRFDDCVDRQSGREQAEEEAMSFNIPLSSPDTDTGNMEGDAIVCHSLRATCHFPPYCCHTQVKPLGLSRWNFAHLSGRTTESIKKQTYSDRRHSHDLLIQISHIYNKVSSSCVVDQINIQIL